MIVLFILLLVGFVFLIIGAKQFVHGSSNLALVLKIPSVIVGLTLVAWGTSSPELAVSVTAALYGSSDIALGNIVGSNIFNILVCLGLSSLLAPLIIPSSIKKFDYPVLIFISILLYIFVITDNKIVFYEGIILLIVFITTLVLNIIITCSIDHKEHIKVDVNVFKCILCLIIGLVFIIIGSELVVQGASNIAIRFGLSETLVGLTIVSIGTSLPELITSIEATRQKQLGIAIGNVIGSNIFNILVIVGVSSSIVSINVDPKLYIDIFIMLSVTLLSFRFVVKDKLSKFEGIILLVLFVIYIIFIIVRN